MTSSPLLQRFPFQIGDVVVRTTGEEAWLSGAVVFSEDAPVAALFVAPEAGGDGLLFAGPAPQTWVAWLKAASALPPSPEPPLTLEEGGRTYRRVRRLPVVATSLGQGAPAMEPRGILADYTDGGGGRLVIYATPRGALAFVGSVLSDGLYDVLPGER